MTRQIQWRFCKEPIILHGVRQGQASTKSLDEEGKFRRSSEDLYNTSLLMKYHYTTLACISKTKILQSSTVTSRRHAENTDLIMGPRKQDDNLYQSCSA